MAILNHSEQRSVIMVNSDMLGGGGGQSGLIPDCFVLVGASDRHSVQKFNSFFLNLILLIYYFLLGMSG